MALWPFQLNFFHNFSRQHSAFSLCSSLSVIITLDNFALGDVTFGFNGELVSSGGVTSGYNSFRDVASGDITSGYNVKLVGSDDVTFGHNNCC